MQDGEEKEQAKQLLTEIIAKQAVILGPDIAVLKARNVGGISIDERGNVTDIKGDIDEVTEKLVEEYVSLSGAIVKSALTSVFNKYPALRKKKQ